MLGSVRQRLVLLILLVGLPLAVATALVVIHLAQTQRQAQRSALMASARALQAAVDAEINKRLAIGRALATSRPLLAGDLADFHKRATEAFSSVADTWVVVADRNGRALINTLEPFGTVLPEMRHLEPHRRALETRENQVSDVFVGSVSKQSIITLHIPVFREGADPLDIIVSVRPDVFVRILREQNVPEGWLAGIIDRMGNFVARSRDHDRLVGTPASAGWRDAARQRPEGYFETKSIEGEPFYSAFTNSDLSGWSTSVATSQAIVNAPFYRSLLLVALSAGSLIALSIVLASWAARRITVPMAALEQAAAALLRGEQVAVGRTGVSEIDHALAAFEASTQALLEREERQRLLVNELNHRVKNTLAVIQSIAAVTSRSAGSVSAYSKSFIARIVGIARTHDLLTASHWEGASLRDVIWNELAPYESEGAGRVTLTGPAVQFSPKVALSLGMVMHEMATNAAKYGALAHSDGRIEVEWRLLTGDVLELRWTESGGPPVKAGGPAGFGSRLIVQSIERELGGTVSFDYRPEGLRCVIAFPMTPSLQVAEAAEAAE